MKEKNRWSDFHAIQLIEIDSIPELELARLVDEWMTIANLISDIDKIFIRFTTIWAKKNNNNNNKTMKKGTILQMSIE
jgi:hypothetical protein